MGWVMSALGVFEMGVGMDGDGDGDGDEERWRWGMGWSWKRRRGGTEMGKGRWWDDGELVAGAVVRIM